MRSCSLSRGEYLLRCLKGYWYPERCSQLQRITIPAAFLGLYHFRWTISEFTSSIFSIRWSFDRGTCSSPSSKNRPILCRGESATERWWSCTTFATWICRDWTPQHAHLIDTRADISHRSYYLDAPMDLPRNWMFIVKSFSGTRMNVRTIWFNVTALKL